MTQTSIFTGSLTSQRAKIATSTGILTQMVESYHAWRERSRTRRDLMRLSEYQLKDIGLTRQDAEDEFQKPFWRA